MAPLGMPLPDPLPVAPGTPSPRKKRNNSTPTRQRSGVDEKKQILQQLVSGTSLDGEPLLLDSLGDAKGSSRTSSRKASREEDGGGTCETSFSIAGLTSLGEWTPRSGRRGRLRRGRLHAPLFVFCLVG